MMEWGTAYPTIPNYHYTTVTLPHCLTPSPTPLPSSGTLKAPIPPPAHPLHILEV